MVSKLWWYEFWMSQWQLIYSKTGKCTILIWSKQKKNPNNFTNKLDVVTHFQNKCAETNGINWRTAINWIHNIAWPLSIFIYTVHYGSLGMELKFGIAGDKWSMDVPTICISILVHGYLIYSCFCGFDIDKIWYDKLSFHGVAILPAIAGSLNLMNYSMGRWDPVIACRKWYDWWKTT